MTGAGDGEVKADANGTRYVDDGFGNTWLMCHAADCDLHVVRPGKVQCNGHCDWHDDTERPALSPAVLAAEGQIVPMDSGGAQIEWHQDGFDIEIGFTADGRIEGVYVGRADG